MQKKIMHIVCIAYRLIAVGKLPIWLRYTAYTPGKMYLKEMMTGMNILNFIVQLKNKSILYTDLIQFQRLGDSKKNMFALKDIRVD